MVQVRVETITPEMAVEYLRHNTNNYRKLSLATVGKYVAEIKAGRWQLNGETIVFGEDGILKDGQHRLAAIAKAGKPIECVVVRGVDKAVEIFDLGKNRTTTQIVNASGFEVNATVTAAVNLLLNPGAPAERGAVIEYSIKHHPELMRAFRGSQMNNNNSHRIASGVLASYLMMRTGAVPFYEIEVFFRAFSTGYLSGLDGYEASPAMVARKMFAERFKGKNGRLIQREQLEVFVLALRDFHKKVKREKNYVVKQPFTYEEYMDRVRKEDGLE